ncbi:MAG: hypothetical protein COC04_03500, partial [Gammaproteobacteria bacterium]
MEETPIQPPTPASPPDLEENPAIELFNKTAASLVNKNRALKVLRHCNQVMFQAETEKELLSEICRIVVEDTGYLFTWIGYPQLDEHKTIKPVAYSGYEDGYLESLVVSWGETKQGKGPAGAVIRTSKPYVVRNVHTDPNFLPWREAAIERGYAAVAAFPLFINEQLPGVILMYAAEPDAFDPEELELLVHFAETLSYGITSMRLKEKNRHIESALRDSEQRFRFMLDTSPIAVRIAIDNNTSVVYANPSYNQLMNTDAVKVLGINPGDFYADKDEYAAIVNELKKGLTVTNRLVNFSIPKQGNKWTLSTYLPIQFEGKDAVLAWFYDITERKQKEDALLLSQEEYVKAFIAVPESLSITTLYDSVFIEINDAYSQLVGYGRDELIGHSIMEFGIWLDFKQRQAMIKEIEDHGSVHNFEVKLKMKNGDIRDVMFSGEPIEINNKACILLAARDFSEKKKAEKELKQLRNYLANIINSMPSIVIGVDTEGHVTQWNHEAASVTGITTEEALGRDLVDVFPRLSSEMDRISDAIKTRCELTDTHKAYHQDGEIHYEDLTIYPLVADGIEGAVLRIDNVTERVRLEEMMIQSEKMLSLGGLAAGMAHEINNPLAGMMQTATVMTSRLTNKLLPANLAAAKTAGIDLNSLYDYMNDRGIFRMLSAINESSLRIADIIDNMLTFARKSDVISLPWNMATLLDKSLALAEIDYDLKKQYDFKSINIIKDYQDDLPDIPCEASKIQQVLLNLFRNGAQAMQAANIKNPTFIVRTHYQNDDEMVTIEIEDNGPGMDENVSKRI